MLDLTQAGPGFLGFVFTFAIAVAAVFLFRSLNKHLRKVRAGEASRRDADAGSAGSGTTDAPSDEASTTDDEQRDGDLDR
ncbi:hypothetical protein RN607_02915 [Demequina capsici]|uniref:Uncharacterized protein n=1 Tax=Demequina capsici TaxID=3075620 RepID=A0AA96FEA5_9MICO|nr:MULTISPECIES: hypothetical protein [unclassified Demequina]WNM25064.1 hypothetical protein RN606_02645 [Demequina sp. OYTSA14]WNM27970.1 hypothetical protein RN607_02915 [Demequina sp. PMTSA13]